MNAPLLGGRKFSQIVLSPSRPRQGDFVVGLIGGTTDVLFSLSQLAQVIGGGSMPVQPVVSLAPEATHVIMAAPANVFSAYAINLSNIDGWLLLLDSATLTFDGPVTPAAAVPLPANATATIDAEAAALVFQNGVCAVLSSGVSPFSQVTNGGLQGYISCQATPQ
jgi:hypothetical protein